MSDKTIQPPTATAMYGDDITVTVDLPSIALGTLRTSATYAALLIQLEGDRQVQIDVLDSVMEALGIHPEEILHNRIRPDCVYVEESARWDDEAAALRQKLGVCPRRSNVG